MGGRGCKCFTLFTGKKAHALARRNPRRSPPKPVGGGGAWMDTGRRRNTRAPSLERRRSAMAFWSCSSLRCMAWFSWATVCEGRFSEPSGAFARPSETSESWEMCSAACNEAWADEHCLLLTAALSSSDILRTSQSSCWCSLTELLSFSSEEQLRGCTRLFSSSSSNTCWRDTQSADKPFATGSSSKPAVIWASILRECSEEHPMQFTINFDSRFQRSISGVALCTTSLQQSAVAVFVPAFGVTTTSIWAKPPPGCGIFMPTFSGFFCWRWVSSYQRTNRRKKNREDT